MFRIFLTRGLALIVVLVLAIPPIANSAPVSDSGIVTFVDEQMSDYADRGGAASVLVVRNGEILVNRGYGVSNRARGIEASEQTVYPIGSITKQFTGAAIALLESEGKLSPDDPVSTFFPDARKDKQNITIRQLLSHAAGLVDSIGPDEERIPRDKYLARAFRSRMVHEPGSTYRYSNVGYSILAAIVEEVSGKPYEAFLTDVFFEPLGMSRTGYIFPQWTNDELAVGYRRSEEWGTVIDRAFGQNGPGWHLMGNGGIHSTLTDMYRWHLSLLHAEVLPQQFSQKLFEPIISEGGESFYGYGWAVEQLGDGRWFAFHDGSNGIFYADCLRLLDEDSIVLVLTNKLHGYDPGFARAIAMMVFAR